jgi:hypothetical protein
MNHSEKKQDEMIFSAFDDSQLHFDFELWKQNHANAICNYRLRSKETVSGDHRSFHAWRKMMAGKYTKFSSAALALVMLTIGLIVLPRSWDGTTRALADTIELARESRKNVLCFVRIERNPENPEQIIHRQWVSFETGYWISRSQDGRVHSLDYPNNREYTYDPVSNTLTVDYLQEGLSEKSWGPLTGSVYLDSLSERSKEAGFKRDAKRGEYSGQDADIYEYSYLTEDGNRLKGRVIFNGEVGTFTETGELLRTHITEYRYLDDIPRDVFEVGVPQNARLVTRLPDEKVGEVLKLYRDARMIGPKRYIAFIVDLSSDAEIIFGDTRRLTRERRRYKDRKAFQYYQQNKKRIERSTQSMLQWWRNPANTRLRYVCNYEDEARYEYEFNEGAWKRTSSCSTFVPYNADIVYYGWPEIHFDLKKGTGSVRIVSDGYAEEKGLICIETLSSGKIYPDRRASLPKRYLRYLDPGHDYMCVRTESWQGGPFDWLGRAKNWFAEWLADVPEKHAPTAEFYSHSIHQVAEIGQTPQEQWYPRKIEEIGDAEAAPREELDSEDAKTIYIDTDPEFPEHIFDRTFIPFEQNGARR